MTDSQTNRTVTTLTLDSNVLITYWNEAATAAIVEQLLSLADQKQIDLAVTTRIHADIPHSPWADRIQELPVLKIQEIGSVTRLGPWVLGKDKFGSEAFRNALDAVCVQWPQSKKQMPDNRDLDHLHGHYLAGRDLFLTWDKPLIAVGQALATPLGMRVMKPEAFLDQRQGDGR